MYKVGPVFACKVMDMASTLEPSSPDFKGANITAGRGIRFASYLNQSALVLERFKSVGLEVPSSFQPIGEPNKAFAFRRFSSAMGSSSPVPNHSFSYSTFQNNSSTCEAFPRTFQAESPRWEASKAPTEGKDPEFQKSSPLDSKYIKTEVPEFQMSTPLHTSPIKTDRTSEYTRESQEIGDQHTHLVPLFRSCKRSNSPEDVKEVNNLNYLNSGKNLSPLTSIFYCQHAAKSCLDKQEKKRTEEEKVRANTLVQIEESRYKLSEELQRTKAALEVEKSKVSKLTEGISAREVAALEAFKQSKEFSNLMFEQFARGYDDCRVVIQEHHCGLDLSWMDVKDDTDE
ncbi:hypothetical protein M0R45_020077 [Rubus argutus]|uniref:Uncharacterized protein n=1 Tax=Rubus argutus TaxID=59490 RepID=A0AAW1X7V8_RUBAR